MSGVDRTTRRRGALALGLLLLLVGGLLVGFGGGAGPAVGAGGGLKLTKEQQRILSGFASFELSQPISAGEMKASANLKTVSARADALLGCPTSFGSNVVVNQQCLNMSDPSLQGRGQAQNETAIAANPSDPTQVIASYNDYRRGDGTCGISFAAGSGGLANGERRFQDGTLPNGFVQGGDFGGAARQYFQASGDPSVAWDTKGNAYYGCMMFQRGLPTTNNPDVSSGVYMFRSTGNSGASWNFPGRPVVQQFSTSASGLPLLDKPYMTVDNHVDSPFQDRIYVTWTKFDIDGSAKIFAAFSRDYGEHFSAPVLVSRKSALCPNGFTAPKTCDANQFSQPFTAPDGTLYVVFSNFNNAEASSTDNHNQVLIAKSTDGGKTFGPVVKAAEYNDLPECSVYQAGQDAFRSCVPEKGSNKDSVFRASNYPSAGLNPTNPKQIVVTIASYINGDSNPANGCVPGGFDSTTGNPLYTGVKTAGACNNKILYSVSNDGGATFTGTNTPPTALPVVNQDAAQAHTDQYFQWAGFSSSGKFAVSYFDRQFGSDETTGYSDISLSASSDLVKFASKRVTTSSMPAPTQFPDAQGNGLFYGDYSGLAVAGSKGMPLWMDTRSPDLFLCPNTGKPGVPPQVCTGVEPDGDQANDENVYTDTVALP
jgi:hypothetical protein